VNLDLARPDHAYFFGFLQTDGHHSEGSRQRGRISVEVSAVDVAVLHAFRTLVSPLYSRVTYRDRVTNFGPNSSATWTVCDLEFRRELLALGLPTGRKSDTVAPPAVPFSDRDYLRGLIDGDGSVGFTGAGRPFVSFVTRSAALAGFFCEQVESITGAHRTPRRNTRDSIYGLMVASDPAAQLAAWLYPPECLALERKRAAAIRVASWVRPAAMRARPVSKRPWTSDEDDVVRRMTIREAAKQLGRSERSVNMRRWRLRHGDHS
jgi:hypothetical protein